MAARDRSNVLLREAAALARQTLLIPRGRTSFTAPVDPSARDLTVFVHGYFASSGVLTPLGEHLARAAVSPWQLHFTYLPAGTVEAHARRLADLVRSARPAGAVHIVGHSLGGLIGRYYRQVLGGPLASLVCLATPHGGTTRARPWTALPLAREIAPGSATLALLARTREALAGVRVCSVVAESDVLVTPVESAALEGHEVVRLPGVGHQSILYDPAAWAHVARVVRGERAGGGGGGGR